MALAAGVRLGPYEVVSPLGAGGMGEVWRARDPRLGREVAVKVLPASLSSDRARLRRFEQEALAAGALSHPNLLAVYDTGVHDGSPYLVFELLEGKTLRDCLREGPVAPRRAVDWAAQAARGLAAAHDKGIVHRDLKPENLFVLSDGRVKILDFGLAKLDPATDDPDVSTSAATASQLTRPGTVVGTVAYMSPEQLRGIGVDGRSDLFSLGVVLHELLTGRRPWSGGTAAEAMAAVLKEDPPELSAVGLAVPPVLGRIVRRCLEKDPAARFRSAHDLAFALEAVGTRSEWSPARSRATWSRAGAWRRRVAFAGAALAATVAAYLIGRAHAGPAPPPSVERITFRRGSVFSARFAPDPDTIVYSAAWEGRLPEIFLARRGSTESRALGFAPASLLALSSSGEMALALEPRFVFTYLHPGVLALAPMAGGAARRLLPGVNVADWSSAGHELAVARIGDNGSRVEWPPGKLAYETSGVVGALRVSPDGNRLACIEARNTSARVLLVEKGGAARELATGWDIPDPGLAWSPDGREVYFSLGRLSKDAALSAVDLHGARRSLLVLPGGLRLDDVARDGRILLAHLQVSLQLRVGTADAAGDRNLSWFKSSFLCDISEDGRRVLFTEYEPEREGLTLYLRETDGSMAVRIEGGFGYGSARLAPDATRIAAVTRNADRLLVVPTREGETVELPRGTIRLFDTPAWLPDGRRLLFLARDASGRRVFEQALDGRPPRPVTEAIEVESLCPSPDGSRFVTSDGKRLVIHSLDGGPPRGVPGEHAQHSLIRWSADGRAVFTYRAGEVPGHLYRIDLATGSEQVVRTLMPPDAAGVWRIHPVVVTPDGRSWAYTVSQTLSDLYVYSGLR